MIISVPTQRSKLLLQSTPGMVFSQQLLSQVLIAFDLSLEQDLQTMGSFLLYKIEIGPFGAKLCLWFCGKSETIQDLIAAVLISNHGRHGSVPAVDTKGSVRSRPTLL